MTNGAPLRSGQGRIYLFAGHAAIDFAVGSEKVLIQEFDYITMARRAGTVDAPFCQR